MVNKCLIIAAGKGSRLSFLKTVKPLVKIWGLPLIERTIFSARKAGIEEFYVVTGFKGQKIRCHLDIFSKKNSIKINHIINNDWEKGNGLSVLCAENYIKERFILLMADHVFDCSIISDLIKNSNLEEPVVLAVDYRLNNPHIDIEDVTKVIVKEGKIITIGKRITNFNAYDTGIFLCSPTVFIAIKQSETNGNYSLSDAIDIIAANGNAFTYDVGEKYWIDIDDLDAFTKAELAIVSHASRTDVGMILKSINQFLSIRLSRQFIEAKISPNQITTLSFFLCVASFISFLIGGYVYLILAGTIAQVSSILDVCDGQIARLTFQETKKGEWLDYILDRYGEAILFSGLTYYVYNLHPDFIYLICGFLTITLAFIHDYSAEKYLQLMNRKILLKFKFLDTPRDFRVLILFICSITLMPELALIGLPILLTINNFYQIILVAERSE